MPSSAKERAKSWKGQVVPRPSNKEPPHPDSQNAALKKTQNQTKIKPIGVTKLLLHLLALSRCHSHLPAWPISMTSPGKQLQCVLLTSQPGHQHRGRRQAGVQFHPPVACEAAVVTPVLSPDSRREGEEFKKQVQLLPP